MNDIQKREKEESEIITIGKVTPEMQQKREIENTLAQNRKMMQEKREERKKEEKNTKDQLFVINEAKIKMGAHIGTFKVLSDTPTIQGKTVGTKVEKSPANFSFLDGFQVLSVVGNWQDVGSAKYQDNEALIKKSTLTVTGKMPDPNSPIEEGCIEFINSGQINVVENINTAGMPVPDNKKPPRIKEIKFYTREEKEITKEGKTHNLLYGEPFFVEITTENIADNTKIEISVKDTDINIKSIVITSNKGKTELISIPLKYYDETQENYSYEEHITTSKYKSFEFTFKIKNQPITSENTEIIPYTYRRNYEELIGLFATSNNGNKDNKENYENKFINENGRIRRLVNRFTKDLLEKNLTINSIKEKVEIYAKILWERVVKRVQKGKLDDRPLYWARNKMQVALKRHYLFKNDIDFEKSQVRQNTELSNIITIFEEKSRNYTNIDFSKAPKDAKKVLITGFDPFVLNQFKFNKLSANINTQNPSGITALYFHGKTIGKAYIQATIIPVRYEDFDNGIIENLVEKNINNFDIMMTMSRNDENFDIERFACKFRGGFFDNMCIGDASNIPIEILKELEMKVTDWDKSRFKQIPDGNEFYETSLPIEKILRGDLAPDKNIVFFDQSVIDNEGLTILHPNKGGKANTTNRYFTVDNIQGKSVEGSGGDYLSNEIMYRATRKRDEMEMGKIKSIGHIHISDSIEYKKIFEIIIKIIENATN